MTCRSEHGPNSFRAVSPPGRGRQLASVMLTRRACLIAARLVLIIQLAGCGSSSAPRVARESQPVWCPNAGLREGVKPARRVAGRFDARILLGKSIAAAQQIGSHHGCKVRIANAQAMLTADWDLQRVDVMTQDGLVVSVRQS
jgi:hypothetical protein